jgi:quercetin dioxygenase-like cupin family protein
MNTELIKQQLKDQGFVHIYEWTDKPDTEYPEHLHQGKVTFYITEGSITMNIDGVHIALRKGDKYDVPVGTLHTAKVGTDGCTFVVGEEIEGDS